MSGLYTFVRLAIPQLFVTVDIAKAEKNLEQFTLSVNLHGLFFESSDDVLL